MNKPIARRSVLAGLAVAAGGLAAPAGFVRNAWSEGRSINIGTYLGPQGEFVRHNVIPKFEKDFGCKINQTQGVTLDQIAILRAQRANPTYSVMFMDDSGVPIAKDDGLIVPLPRDKMPNLEKVIPGFVVSEGHGVAFAVSALVPYFNSDVVTSIDSYQDLWDPKFQGRFMMPTPKQTQSLALLIAAAALVTGKPLKDAQYEIDSAWKKIGELKHNILTVYDNNVTAILQVSQGQADVGGPDFTKSIIPYIRKGAAIGISYPKEGIAAGVNCITVVKGAPEPDLAAAFANRMLDPEVQTGLANATFSAPSVAGLTLDPEVAKVAMYPEAKMKEKSLLLIDWSYIYPRRADIIRQYNQVLAS
ncbi:extracellular solute-binding protein [Roseixanthobacter pseudopolyaromaticivorans]|uniref:extracellular solute-binding protein n=1 Tax=Xanthobacteraceae TaxID=335928 RepID=UPI003727D69C